MTCRVQASGCIFIFVQKKVDADVIVILFLCELVLVRRHVHVIIRLNANKQDLAQRFDGCSGEFCFSPLQGLRFELDL